VVPASLGWLLHAAEGDRGEQYGSGVHEIAVHGVPHHVATRTGKDGISHAHRAEITVTARSSSVAWVPTAWAANCSEGCRSQRSQ